MPFFPLISGKEGTLILHHPRYQIETKLAPGTVESWFWAKADSCDHNYRQDNSNKDAPAPNPITRAGKEKELHAQKNATTGAKSFRGARTCKVDALRGEAENKYKKQRFISSRNICWMPWASERECRTGVEISHARPAISLFLHASRNFSGSIKKKEKERLTPSWADSVEIYAPLDKQTLPEATTFVKLRSRRRETTKCVGLCLTRKLPSRVGRNPP